MESTCYVSRYIRQRSAKFELLLGQVYQSLQWTTQTPVVDLCGLVLETIQDGAVNGGATADDCPGVDDLNSGLTSLRRSVESHQCFTGCKLFWRIRALSVSNSGGARACSGGRISAARKSGLWKFCSLSGIATILHVQSQVYDANSVAGDERKSVPARWCSTVLVPACF